MLGREITKCTDRKQQHHCSPLEASTRMLRQIHPEYAVNINDQPDTISEESIQPAHNQPSFQEGNKKHTRTSYTKQEPGMVQRQKRQQHHATKTKVLENSPLSMERKHSHHDRKPTSTHHQRGQNKNIAIVKKRQQVIVCMYNTRQTNA